MSEKKEIKLIPAIDAGEFDDDLLRWMDLNDYPTHYDNDIISFYKGDGHDNPLVRHIEETYNYKFDRSKNNSVAVWGT